MKGAAVNSGLTSQLGNPNAGEIAAISARCEHEVRPHVSAGDTRNGGGVDARSPFFLSTRRSKLIIAVFAVIAQFITENHPALNASDH